MHRFPTPTPPRLDVELRSGALDVRTDDVTETTVELAGHADTVAATVVEQRGDEIVVIAPRRLGGLFGRGGDLRVTVVAPRRTRLAIQTGSGDVTAHGEYGTTSVTSGSGLIELDHVGESARLRSGSAKIRVERIDGDVDVTTGSGDITIGVIGGSASAHTGSGNVELGTGGTALRASTGSGDVSVGEAPDEVSVKTASGDVRIEAISHGDVFAKAASGHIRAGVRSGTAALLDVRTVSGRVRSALEAGDAPAGDEQRARLTLSTVSGNIDLVRV